MSIAALPEATIRALSSSQTISDPAFLVKELIDNALDAKASSISVEVSYNCLDTIQVRDNGIGIAPHDRDLLGRRYCTSKIREFNDISTLGGSSLGFRGEALASVVELSESLTISTRVDGEPFGTKLKIGRRGGILSQDRDSHPTGTTVRISSFLATFPVRKQTALKAPVKTLSKIKSILQTYALAKPLVRYSLKIVKAEKDGFNWIYPASKSLTPSVDAAVKVVGKAAVAQCEWKLWRSSVGLVDQDSRDTQLDDFMLEALVPTLRCDPTVVSGTGQFISVDSRPLAHRKHAMKEMISIFKSYTQNITRAEGKVANPFLLLNIICPLGSYDINVEPGKDEVLFTDEARIVTICESFFKAIYGDLGSKTTDERPEPSTKRQSDLLDELSHHLDMVDNQREKPAQTTNACSYITLPTRQLLSRSTMYSGEDEYPNHDIGLESSNNDNHEIVGSDTTTSNPWTIAKLNAPVRRAKPRWESQGEAQYNGQLFTPRKDIRDASTLQTPLPRSISTAKVRLGRRGSPWSTPRTQTFYQLPELNDSQRKQQPEQSQHENLDNWLATSPSSTRTPAPTRFIPINTSVTVTPLSDIPDILQRSRKQKRSTLPTQSSVPRAVQKPFVCPLGKNQPRPITKAPSEKPPPKRTLDFIKSSPRDDKIQLGAIRPNDMLPEYIPRSSHVKSGLVDDSANPEGYARGPLLEREPTPYIHVPVLALQTTVNTVRHLANTLAPFDDYICFGKVGASGDLVWFSREFAGVLDC